MKFSHEVLELPKAILGVCWFAVLVVVFVIQIVKFVKDLA